jgi:DNA polymerase-4/DNA polymerase V
MSSWRNAIAHVDADCFFASCELVRRPDLRGRPVCVLSSQDACIVAKTYEAKAVGIKTGMPVWEARRLLPQAVYLPADFRFYGLVSAKMFAIFRRYSPQVEAYSIDEGFINMNGMRSLWRKGFRALADDIRQCIHRDVGITASVGISTTRTLAKMASEANKPNGSTVIPAHRIRQFLAGLPVGDIPGIGRNRVMLLHQFQIYTALEFCLTDAAKIHRMLGRSGISLRDELNGISVFAPELQPPMPKSIARTASLGAVSMDRRLIAAHLSYHTTRVVSELVRRHLTTSRLTVFLRLKSFEAVARKLRMNPCNDLGRLNRAVTSLLGEIFVRGEQYRACGVIASQLMPDAGQGDLFALRANTGRQLKLIQTMDAINRKYGAQTVKPARAMRKSRHGIRFKYPLLTAN